MEKIQITVKEENDWEGETFNYVLEVTPEEEKIIIEKCEKYGDDSLSVKRTSYTDDEIKIIDKSSSNSYMNFIAKYELREGKLKKWEGFGDVFYKGNGVNRI